MLPTSTRRLPIHVPARVAINVVPGRLGRLKRCRTCRGRAVGAGGRAHRRRTGWRTCRSCTHFGAADFGSWREGTDDGRSLAGDWDSGARVVGGADFKSRRRIGRPEGDWTTHHHPRVAVALVHVDIDRVPNNRSIGPTPKLPSIRTPPRPWVPPAPAETVTHADWTKSPAIGPAAPRRKSQTPAKSISVRSRVPVAPDPRPVMVASPIDHNAGRDDLNP